MNDIQGAAFTPCNGAFTTQVLDSRPDYRVLYTIVRIKTPCKFDALRGWLHVASPAVQHVTSTQPPLEMS
jgi:hypothetical protein